MSIINVPQTDTFDQWRVKTNLLGSNVGDLSNLLTTDKSNIIAAINELYQLLASGGGGGTIIINTYDYGTFANPTGTPLDFGSFANPSTVALDFGFFSSGSGTNQYDFLTYTQPSSYVLDFGTYTTPTNSVDFGTL